MPWIIFQGKEREDVAAVDEANTVLHLYLKEIKLKITPNKNWTKLSYKMGKIYILWTKCKNNQFSMVFEVKKMKSKDFFLIIQNFWR